MRQFAELAKICLVYTLRSAHAGEYGAIKAYEGHWRSLKDPKEQEEIKKIQREETEHREAVGIMLYKLGYGPDYKLERRMGFIGTLISIFCKIGWYFPMWGAGRMEHNNVHEYEKAARLAYEAGLVEHIEPLLEMAEVEWDHEDYFRKKCETHWLSKILRVWKIPPSRENIRESFHKYKMDFGPIGMPAGL